MRNIKFSEGSFYHIYNRGAGKQKIFQDFEDYERFKKLLYICNGTKPFVYRDYFIEQKKDAYDFDRGEPMVNIVAWVLMPNHFHILISPRYLESGKSLSDFLRKLTLSYTKYFNLKHGKSGTLFEGTFKATSVPEDNYFKYLFSYIHLNPVKLIQSDWKAVGIKDTKKTKIFLDKFKHSSYLDYVNFSQMNRNVRKEEKVLSLELSTDFIDSGDFNFEKNILKWITFNPDT